MEIYYFILSTFIDRLPWRLSDKESICNAGETGLIPGQEDPLEKEMATYCSILVSEIPWTENPDRLQSMELQKSQTRLSDKAKTITNTTFTDI